MHVVLHVVCVLTACNAWDILPWIRMLMDISTRGVVICMAYTWYGYITSGGNMC